MTQEVLDRAMMLTQKISDAKNSLKEVSDVLRTDADCLISVKADGFLNEVTLIKEFSLLDAREVLFNYGENLIRNIEVLEKELKEL